MMLDRVGVVADTVFDLFETRTGWRRSSGWSVTVCPRLSARTAYRLPVMSRLRMADLHEVELRMLEEVREELNINRLHAAAIEWGARVRHLKL